MKPAVRYHALGNVYLVLDTAVWGEMIAPQAVRRLCDAATGPGADGVLLGPLPTAVADFGLRIFNPDGSEAEMSGNGLRIFARWLWDGGRAGDGAVAIETPAGAALAWRPAGDSLVSAELGPVQFESMDERLVVNGRAFRCCVVSVGNPHCVVLGERPTPALARRWGARIETAPRFPARINVQFLAILNRNNIRIEIWERGAGYTAASGSSACAAAAVAHRLGRCEADVAVKMPGGQAAVELGPDWMATLTGPVVKLDATVVD